MIYVYIGTLAAYLLLFLLSAKEAGNPFQKMASFLLRAIQKAQKRQQGKGGGKRDWKRELFDRQLGDKLKILRSGIPAAEQVREHYRTLYSSLLLVVFLGDLLCLAAWASARSSPRLTEGTLLRRNGYGEGEAEVTLAAKLPDMEEEEIFDYLVGERSYTKEELQERYQEAQALLPKAILGENERAEDVRFDLELISELEGYPFAISWESSAYSLVNTDGAVHNEELKKGEIVTLTACFSYEGWSARTQIPVQVNPVVYTPEESVRKQLEELLREREEGTKSEEAMRLPEEVGEEPVLWREVAKDKSAYLLILALLAAGLLRLGKGRDLDQKLEARKRELLLDYPEIVNKLALYMGAGMTIRNAFFKMGEDYKKQSENRRRYVYEEVLLACYEMQGGKSETEAYDHFGKRCQLQAYVKLSALLSQNIRKGSNDLLRMLRQEAEGAFAERKSLAKKLGEEAGTKLLLPMMMMLCIVMVIIMIPAYFSFTL